MCIFKEIFTTEGRLNRWFHLKYQLLWRLIYLTIEYILYFISSTSISTTEGIFITMFPGTWSLVAGILTVITFIIMKFITSPMVTTNISPEILTDFVPGNWAIVTGIWAIISGVGIFMLMIRRLHDLNKSGWFAVLAVVPIIGLIFSIYLFCTRGQIGSNKYGEHPL